MTQAEADKLQSFMGHRDWMFVKVSSADWHRLCPHCRRTAANFVAWMIRPPSDCLCVDCYEGAIGYRLSRHADAVKT